MIHEKPYHNLNIIYYNINNTSVARSSPANVVKLWRTPWN